MFKNSRGNMAKASCLRAMMASLLNYIESGYNTKDIKTTDKKQPRRKKQMKIHIITE